MDDYVDAGPIPLQRRLYHPSEVARVLGLPLQSVYGWIRAGEIRASKIGGRLFVSPNELTRLLGEESGPTDSAA